MIQSFRYDKEQIYSKFRELEIENNEILFHVIHGKPALKFFLKQILYVLVFIYSTCFLAVALPFVTTTPFTPIYFIGGMATTILIARIVNYIIKYQSFGSGSIKVAPDKIEVTGKASITTIQAKDIACLEHNILGNIVVKEKHNSIAFPINLLSPEDKEVLLSLFNDRSPKRSKLYKKIWDGLDAVAVALVLAAHIIQFVVQTYYIASPSMEDTLLVGDHLFVDKLTYGPKIPKMLWMDKPLHLSFLGIRGIKRGDIVIFKAPDDKHKDYIKRCIALPGDKFLIKDGSVYVNGKKQIESYAKKTFFPGSISLEKFNAMSAAGRKIVIKGNHLINGGIVPEGKIVILGDNRTNSKDSRALGYLDPLRIKGRAFILYWNTKDMFDFKFNRLGLIH